MKKDIHETGPFDWGRLQILLLVLCKFQRINGFKKIFKKR